MTVRRDRRREAGGVRPSADRLRIALPAGRERRRARSRSRVKYRGIPAQGLRLINNIHGERTVFSENWPNSARQWLPMIDHPYDKATGEFIVTAPAHYQVVANGLLVEEVDLAGGLRRTHWKQSVPIASWLTRSAWRDSPSTTTTSSAASRSRSGCFRRIATRRTSIFELTGRRAFEFFSDWIGPYPYEKLAHVRPPASAAAPSTRRRSSTARRASPAAARRSSTRWRTNGSATPSPKRTGTTCG